MPPRASSSSPTGRSRELGGAVIGITPETSTSVQLLRVLLALKYEVTPRAWVGVDDPSDAVLLDR